MKSGRVPPPVPAVVGLLAGALLSGCGSSGGQCRPWPDAGGGATCNAIFSCTCADGTKATAGCSGPPTCSDACCAHGGVAGGDQ